LQFIEQNLIWKYWHKW